MQISRRNAMLGATAAVATAATTAPLAIKAAGVKAALAGEPLVALEAELIEARAAGNEVGALYCAAHDKVGDWAFGWPRADLENPVMNLMRGWLRDNNFGGANQNRVSLPCIKSFNHHNQISASGEVLARRKAEGRERIRWWVKARRAQDAAQEEAGLPGIDALLASNHERVDAIEDQLWDTPAGTMRGVIIRLREAHRDYVAVQCGDEPEEDFYAVAFGKVLRDLERLAGEARS